MIDVLIGYAEETLTVADAVKTLTESVYKTGRLTEVRKAVVTVETAAIRYWTTGADPVADTSGHLAEAGAYIELTLPHSVENFKAIRDGSTSAVIQVSYEKDV